MTHRRIAVVIPCYNEAARIRSVIEQLPDWVTTIIAVDDASRDDTHAVLLDIPDSRLVVLQHRDNQGVGAATRTGYREALQRDAEICIKMDGDGQMSVADLPALLAPLLDGRADFTKGNRFRDIAALNRMPKIRLLGNSALSGLTKLVSGYWTVLDPTNGFTAIRTDTLGQLNLDRLAARYFFETSMLVELNIGGAVVEDVSMPARYGDERSSLRVSTVLFQFPPLLLRGLLRRFFWRYVIHDFNVLTVAVFAGAPLLAFGVLFGGLHWIRSVRTGVPATAGTAILAALPIVLGVQFLLVALVIDLLMQPRRGIGVARSDSRAPATAGNSNEPSN